jgi:RNase P/RNase MRP subunit p29
MDESIVSEIIGKDVCIISSPNPDLLKIEGKIVGESKNTITILTTDGEKKIQKKGLKLKIKIAEKWILMDLGIALMRPEDRTKKLYKKLLKK